MKRKTLLLIFQLLILSNCYSFSSKFNNYWVFGTNAALDFNQTPTSVQNRPMFTYDNTASACDDNGNLLFYTNGVNVYTNTNAIMQNGSGLMGSLTGGQTALIVPVNNKLTYIFTVPEFGSQAGLRYSTVNISLNNFQGAVTAKNILLHTPSTEKLAAYFDQGNNRFWVITHEFGNANFNAYKVDANGLDLVPVTSTVGIANSGGSYGYDHGAMGQLVISQDGSHIANACEYSNEIQLFDFDKQTGIISNPITIPNYSMAWGVAFSPNGSKLYFTQWTNTLVYQFDLSVYNANAIQSSATLVGSATGTGSYNVGYMQLAPDGIIYIARYGTHYLATVSDPNATGSLCNFNANGINLGSGISGAGLSTGPVFSDLLTEINEIGKTEIISLTYPNPAQNHFRIELKHVMNDNISFQFYNSIGNLISLPFIVDFNSIKVNCEGLAKGMYNFLIADKNNIARGKVIIE